MPTSTGLIGKNNSYLRPAGKVLVALPLVVGGHQPPLAQVRVVPRSVVGGSLRWVVCGTGGGEEGIYRSVLPVFPSSILLGWIVSLTLVPPVTVLVGLPRLGGVKSHRLH